MVYTTFYSQTNWATVGGATVGGRLLKIFTTHSDDTKTMKIIFQQQFLFLISVAPIYNTPFLLASGSDELTVWSLVGAVING